jgi:hypothetical protein
MAVAGGDDFEDGIEAIFGPAQFAVDHSKGRFRWRRGPGSGFDGERPLGSETLD